MKSVIKNQDVEQGYEYPCLKEFSSSVGSYIVLFALDSTGVVVNSKHPSWKVGELHSSFIEKEFKPFKGTIELSN